MAGHNQASSRPLSNTATQLHEPHSNTPQHPTIAITEQQKPQVDERRRAFKFNAHHRRSRNSKRSFLERLASTPGSEEQTTGPTDMMSQLPSIHLTRTGRISKAKKGLKVHNCENCGRAYTRAEHLRRHQKNHAQDKALICDFRECGKTFYRLDLLQRHQERHNEPEKDSRQHSVYSQEASPELTHVPVPSGIAPTAMPPAPPYYPHHPLSPAHEPAALPRYTSDPFRTPQVPCTLRFPSSTSYHVVRPSSVMSIPNNSKHQASYAHHSVAAPVPLDATALGLGWSEVYSQSPGCSSSSGYASPIPGPGDYANMFASATYGPSRTRASSNASFVEWAYLPRSPTSVASTMTYTAPALAYIGTTYPMTTISMPTSMDLMTDNGQFASKMMMQRDEEEAMILFRDHSYGMGPLAHTYPLEQYLDCFWRLFHPTFPVVHRPTFERMTAPPLLHAAMISIGGQYSTDARVKHRSRILHDQCIKLLEKRDREHHFIAEPERLCDYQALFLIELYSHHWARRAAKTLSPRFERVYRKSAEDFRTTTTKLSHMVVGMGEATLEQWTRWIELATWQRLLLCCFVLESQQSLLLARELAPSLIQETGLDLPLPGPSSLWDASTCSEWFQLAQQYPPLPKYVYEVNADLATAPFDSFQSCVMITARFNRLEASEPLASATSNWELEYLLDGSSTTRRKLLTAKLLQVTPLRALLAVSGESWIFSEKVTSAQKFASLKTTLRSWVVQLCAQSSADATDAPVEEALKLSVDILQQALLEPQNLSSAEMDIKMGIYFAGLVLWVVVVAATMQVKKAQHVQAQQIRRCQSQPTDASRFMSSTLIPAPSSHILTSTLRHSSNSSPSVVHSATQTPTTSGSALTSTANPLFLSHADITFNTLTFLSTAFDDLGSKRSLTQFSSGITQYQTGCTSLLLWVKMRLRGETFDNSNNSTDTWAHRPSEGQGELINGVTASLDRILARGWHGWDL